MGWRGECDCDLVLLDAVLADQDLSNLAVGSGPNRLCCIADRHVAGLLFGSFAYRLAGQDLRRQFVSQTTRDNDNLLADSAGTTRRQVLFSAVLSITFFVFVLRNLET